MRAARHGGVTEAQVSGADLIGIGKHAQHRDLNTTNSHTFCGERWGWGGKRVRLWKSALASSAACCE
jgi:hypothetical protein